MSRLLDLGTVLRLMRGHRRVVAHASSYVGQLSISAVTVFGIETWLFNPNTASRFVFLYPTFMQQFVVRDVTRRIGSQAARIARHLPIRSRSRAIVDALVAVTALEHNLILATCDPTLYATFAGLTFENWAVP